MLFRSDQWSSLSSAYRAIDARDVWKSIKAGKGIGIGSLFYDAKQAGWKDDTAYKKPSAAEIEQRRKERAERDALAAQQELAAQEAAAVKAQELWAAATPCESHAYLERKGLAQAFALKAESLVEGITQQQQQAQQAENQSLAEARERDLQKTIIDVKGRYGKNALVKGRSLRPEGRRWCRLASRCISPIRDWRQ